MINYAQKLRVYYDSACLKRYIPRKALHYEVFFLLKPTFYVSRHEISIKKSLFFVESLLGLVDEFQVGVFEIILPVTILFFLS